MCARLVCGLRSLIDVAPTKVVLIILLIYIALLSLAIIIICTILVHLDIYIDE